MPVLLSEWVAFLTFALQVLAVALAIGACSLVARGWVDNRRDAALGLRPRYYRPIRLRPWR